MFTFETQNYEPHSRKQKSLCLALGGFAFIIVVFGSLTSHASEGMSNYVDTRHHLRMESNCHYLDPEDLVIIPGLEGSHHVLQDNNTTKKVYVEFRTGFNKIYRLVEGTSINPGASSVKGEGKPLFLGFLDVGKDFGKGVRVYTGIISDRSVFYQGARHYFTCRFVKFIVGPDLLSYVLLAVDVGDYDDWLAFQEIIRANGGEIDKEANRVFLKDTEDAEITSGHFLTLFTARQFTKILRPFGTARVLAPFSGLDDELTKTAGKYYEHGFAFFKEKKFQKAKNNFEQILKLKVNRFTSIAYLGRATVLNELGQYQAAIQDFNHVIRLDPENRRAFLLRGLAHEKSDHVEEALKDYHTAGGLYPENGYYDGKPQFYYFLLSAKTQSHFESARRACIAASVNPEYKWCLEKMDEWTPNIPAPRSKIPFAVFQQPDHGWDGVLTLLGTIAVLGIVGGIVNPGGGENYAGSSTPNCDVICEMNKRIDLNDQLP